MNFGVKTNRFQWTHSYWFMFRSLSSILPTLRVDSFIGMCHWYIDVPVSTSQFNVYNILLLVSLCHVQCTRWLCTPLKLCILWIVCVFLANTTLFQMIYREMDPTIKYKWQEILFLWNAKCTISFWLKKIGKSISIEKNKKNSTCEIEQNPIDICNN